jgi:hypothetical protein
MLTYFINRAGKGLSASRRTKLERAKTSLSVRIRNAKQQPNQEGCSLQSGCYTIETRFLTLTL